MLARSSAIETTVYLRFDIAERFATAEAMSATHSLRLVMCVVKASARALSVLKPKPKIQACVCVVVCNSRLLEASPILAHRLVRSKQKRFCSS